MPFITVDHFAGLAPADRRRLQERLAAVVMEAFGAPAANVRIYTRALNPADVYLGDGAHETGLPVIRAEFLPGRTLEQKRALVKGLALVVSDVFQVQTDHIRTVLYEREREQWARGETLVADAQ